MTKERKQDFGVFHVDVADVGRENGRFVVVEVLRSTHQIVGEW